MSHGRTPLRRAAAIAAVSALSIAAVATASSPASAAVDPAPATSAGTWLAGQLTEGLVLSPYDDPDGNPYPDYGVSIDVALAMHEVGAPASIVDGISDAIAGRIDEYVTGDAAGDANSEYAGATAKAAVLAQIAGDDPTAFGGVDLIDQLEGLVVASGPATGRIQDISSFGDYSNSLGQAFAVGMSASAPKEPLGRCTLFSHATASVM